MIRLKFFLVVAILMSCLNENLSAQQPINSIQQLDKKQQSIVAISAFTANGNMTQLQKALSEGLNAGLTINEIKEVLVQLYAYAGFPRSLNAISTLEFVIKKRQQKAIKDLPGKAASKLVSAKSKFEIGKDVQTQLTGSTATGAPQRFVPIIDTFLKEHLFADIFSRDVLDWKTREIATISALASIGGVEPQLGGHFNVGLNTGLTEVQLKSIVSIIQSKVGSKEGTTASQVLQTVLKGRQINKATEKERSNYATTKSTGTNDIVNEGENYKKESTDHTMIFPKGEKIRNDNFTGNAWLQQMILPDSSNSTQVGNVTFEPGARSKWHLHPAGQILLITGGTGYYQEKGSAKRIIKKGEVIKCPPNVPHWHGASKNEELIQIAITNTQKGAPVWLTEVTDEEYNNQ